MSWNVVLASRTTCVTLSLWEGRRYGGSLGGSFLVTDSPNHEQRIAITQVDNSKLGLCLLIAILVHPELNNESLLGLLNPPTQLPPQDPKEFEMGKTQLPCGVGCMLWCYLMFSCVCYDAEVLGERETEGRSARHLARGMQGCSLSAPTRGGLGDVPVLQPPKHF
eukprot:5424353-Amphidinium_carterae.1